MATSDQVLSLFSGAGGLSFGFALAGAKPVAGAEINEDACCTYEANLGTPCHRIDLGKITPTDLRSRLGIVGSPFAIIGGPPCQGFSSAGAKAGDDPRNRLIFNYLHIVEEFQPRWFLFENVEGLLTANGGTSIYSLALAFIKLGYTFRIEKVNFAGFGVPQARKRVVIVGNRLGFEFRFPGYTHSYDAGKHRCATNLQPSPTLSEALNGLDLPVARSAELASYATHAPLNEFDARMRRGNATGRVSHHVRAAVSDRDMQRFSGLRPGQTMKDLPQHLWPKSYRRRAFRRVMDGTPTDRRGGAPAGLKRLRGDLNCLTITSAATQEFVHPTDNRTLTLRECARLQSFEDSFQFSGTTRSAAQQIGNAVPPLAAEVLAKTIVSLDGALGSGQVAPLRSTHARLLGFHLTNSSGMSPALDRTRLLLQSLVNQARVSEREETALAAG
jgi:DNA (cytosine-5)-methyltransferase 1